MNQCDTLSTQWIHIEHMHKGVLFKSNYYSLALKNRGCTVFAQSVLLSAANLQKSNGS